MKKIKYRRLAAMAASLLCCLIFTAPALYPMWGFMWAAG